MKSSLGFKGKYNPDRKVGGYVLSRVYDGKALAEAGLKEGDILTKVNGRRIMFFADLHDILIATAPGKEVKVTYLRNGEEFETTAITQKK
jgi:S1-C subfamily serine protease